MNTTRVRVDKIKNKALNLFLEHEWEILDKEFFGEKNSWNNQRYWVSVLDKDNKIIGALILDIKGGVAEMKDIVVKENSRGQGVGKTLVEKAEIISQKEKVHKIRVITGKDWKVISFYNKLGYVTTGEMPQHYFKQDFIELSKIF